MLEELKREVCAANKALKELSLVVLTWGNVSGIDREKNLVVIKPSGVDYSSLKEEDMVVVDLEGKVVEGNLLPSVDLPTHLEIYKKFKGVNGITHTHSSFATAFAQAEREIKCYGTTQADSFKGPIPLTRILKEEELDAYEKNTGLAITETLKDKDVDSCPGTIVTKHGVFAFGKDPLTSVKNALIIEECAKMAYLTETINKEVKPLPNYIEKYHHERKHGKNATYGQRNSK